VSPRAAGVGATAAAGIATAADLLLLWVTNARRPELGLTAPPAAALVAGSVLGVLAIPLYGLGYWQVATGLPSGRAARTVVLLGAATGVIGAALHGLTGVVLRDELRAGAAAADPLAVIARHGRLLVPLWGLGIGCAVAAAALYAHLVLAGESAWPRWMAAVNPVVLSCVLGALAAPSGVLRAFLLPAAPNLANAIFFGLTVAVRRDRDRTLTAERSRRT